MFASLRHRAVNGRDNKNRAVHLGRTRDHVFNVVSMSRAVNVGVMPLLRFVFDVGNGNRNDFGIVANRTPLGDIRVFLNRRHTLFREHFRKRAGQCRLSVVDVADRPNVHVRFCSLEFFFCHGTFSSSFIVLCPPCIAEYAISTSLSNFGKQTGVVILEFQLETGIEPVTSSLPRTCSTN